MTGTKHSVLVVSPERKRLFRSERPKSREVQMSAITTAKANATADATASRWRWLAFAVAIAASVMDLLDGTITQVAGPAIRRDLGGSYAVIQWVTASYTLAMAAGLLTGGRLGD